MNDGWKEKGGLETSKERPFSSPCFKSFLRHFVEQLRELRVFWDLCSVLLMFRFDQPGREVPTGDLSKTG